MSAIALGYCRTCAQQGCTIHTRHNQAAEFFRLVDRAAHDRGHSTPQQGCPGCPQPAVCIWCDQSQDRHRDGEWAEHYTYWRQSETRWWRDATVGPVMSVVDGAVTAERQVAA